MANVFGINVHLYGLIIGLGIYCASEVSIWLANKRGIEPGLVQASFWRVIIPAIVGARLYHIVHLWTEYYRDNLIDIIKVWNGGLGIWGAVIGGVVGTIIVNFQIRRQIPGQARNDGVKWTDILDIAVVGVPLGQAIGRWGNFVNKEIMGGRTNLPWGMNVNGVRVHPLFAYESFLDLMLFFALIYLAKRNSTKGKITSAYLIGYGAIRLVLEPLRPTDSVWRIFNVPTAQVVAVMVIIVGMVLYKKTQPLED